MVTLTSFCPSEHLFVHLLGLDQTSGCRCYGNQLLTGMPQQQLNLILLLGFLSPGPQGKYLQEPVHSRRCIPLVIAGRGAAHDWCRMGAGLYPTSHSSFGRTALEHALWGSSQQARCCSQERPADNTSRTWPFLLCLTLSKPCFPSLRAFPKFNYRHASPSLDYVLGNTQKLSLEAL